MRIAIIGAGLAGLAACYTLCQRAAVTLYDPNGIGGGASGVAPGLLHPYGGRKAHLSKQGQAGMAATRHLLDLVTQQLGYSISDARGILRLITFPDQIATFQQAAQNSDVEWWPAERCREVLPGSEAGAGIWISSGVTVQIKPYLKGLFQLCQQQGAMLIREAVNELQALDSFDQVILATGADSIVSEGDIHQLKGQAVRLRWPTQLTPPPMSLIAGRYLVMEEESCLVGATFEHQFESAAPDLTVAKSQLLPRITALYPQLSGAEVLECIAGIRATTPTRVPRIKQLAAGLWSLRGFGSKGLLYHALLAQQLADQLGLR